MPERLKIIVGISGGVDSAVAALLLLQQGHEVHGVHMTNWDADEAYCSAADDYQVARQVCRHLNIPLHHVHFAAAYREQVFAEFVREYQAGRTPNPDVLCNRFIKFGSFLAYAMRLGADRIATGHYARLIAGAEPVLCKALDSAKDQTYFLHTVTASALTNTLFPLGELTKTEVRRIATEHGLPNHDRPDSTGICFIGERPLRQFLARYIDAKPGPVLTADGEQLGCHHGVAFYTIGQRTGLGIGGRRGASGEPWYVARKDPARNALIVVQGHAHPLLWSDRLLTAQPHWINGTPAALAGGAEFRCRARIRHRHPEAPCTVRRLAHGSLAVRFLESQWAIAPGQSVVFYDGQQCLGGAVIAAAGADTFGAERVPMSASA